jgi:dihydroorotase
MAKRILLKNGRVIDPASGLDKVMDIVIMDSRVASIKKDVDIDVDINCPEATPVGEGWQVIDCTGKLVVPGLVDLHTHLREPGEEYKETIRTGTMAAASGGVTTLLCMANTEPVNDNAAITKMILDKAENEGSGTRVLPVGAVTKGLMGEAMSEMAELKEAGCVALSDDGRPVMDGALMRRALEYASGLSMTIITHAEDLCLVAGGVMNLSEQSTRLGLQGAPSAAEDSMTARDIALSELTGAHLHIAHVSTIGAIELIRSAKARGVNVTAEATPHHLWLDDSYVKGYDTDAKMNPPLRCREDVLALRAALKDGTIDCIATDHAPHSSIEKDIEFDYAANGVVGLETSLALALALVDEGVLTLTEAIARMSSDPARVMKLNAGCIKIGAPADIAIIDPELKWTVDPSNFKSKGRNTPFKGRELKGRVTTTIVNGRVIYNLDDLDNEEKV